MAENSSPEKLGLRSDRPTSSREVHDVLDTDLALALSTGPQINAFSVQSVKLYVVLVVSFMGSLSFGFDTADRNRIYSQFTLLWNWGRSNRWRTGYHHGDVTFNRSIVASFFAGPVSDNRGEMFIGSNIVLAVIRNRLFVCYACHYYG
ncbi:hypothetical protein C8R43DRAFT_948574 [Mycena crocata]|nr:hypothetical protein C8R43DRAFT_948574 [Mycena crocata]